MEKNKKGFTLTEIIIVIVILAILALIAIPGIGKLIENGKINYNKNLEKELILMAKNYYADNKAKLPRGQLNDDGDPMYTTSVSLTELENGNYVTNKVLDADKGSCEESYVYVENESGGYEYYPCLACDNYKSDNAYCSLDSDGAGTGHNPVCEITYQDYVPGTWTNKDVTANITGYHESGIPFFMVNSTIKVNATANNATYKIKEEGAFVVEAYSRTGNKGVCAGGTTKGQDGEDDENTKILIDRVDPICTSITTSPSGVARNKTITVEAKDEDSGIKGITIPSPAIFQSDDNGNKTRTVTYKVNRNGTYQAEVEDNAGNKAVCNITVTNVDETPILTSSGLEIKTTNALGLKSSSGYFYVKNNDTITVTMNFTLNLKTKPTVTIAGVALTVSGSGKTYTATINSSSLPEGQYPVIINNYIDENDDVGQTVTTSSTPDKNGTKGVYVDKTAPKLTIVKGTSGKTLLLTGNGTDTGSNIKDYKIPGSSTWTTTNTYTATTEGTYTFVVRDNAGNETTTTVTVTKGSSCAEYNSCEHSNCGVESYYRCSSCGCQTYRPCTYAACGSPNSSGKCSCSASVSNQNVSSCNSYCKTYYGSGASCNTSGSSSTFACIWTATSPGCSTYNACSSCGVAKYKSCSNSACGCKYYGLS